MRLAFYAATALLLVACSATADSLESAQSSLDGRDVAAAAPARMCSWNIRRLGHKFDGRDKDLVTTARIIEDNCDVLAVQEVMQLSGGVTPGFVGLGSTLGQGWESVRTERPRPDTSAANAEHYAFYFRRSTASLCQGWQGVRHLADDEDAFLREPGWTCLKVRAHAKELLFVTFHAIFGSVADRKREVSFLDDDLDSDGQTGDFIRAVRASRPGDADILVVGDFNLTTNQMRQALPTFEDRTVGAGSTINNTDAITSNLYDHLLVPPGQQVDNVSTAEVLDVRSQQTGDTFFRSVSDHLPIRFTLGRTGGEAHAGGDSQAPVVPPALDPPAGEPAPLDPPVTESPAPTPDDPRELETPPTKKG